MLVASLYMDTTLHFIAPDGPASKAVKTKDPMGLLGSLIMTWDS